LVTDGHPPGSAPPSAKAAAGATNWLQTFKPRPTAAARLFCFPFAGGGAQSFSQWPNQLPENVELCAVQLPGRETRMREPPIADAHALVRAMAPSLVPKMREPFVLFGHSMGAILAFELARLLETQWQLSPRLLIVSGRVAPHRRPPREPINRLPQSEFVEGLRHLNGTPPEILADQQLMAMIAPMLRADFAVHEEYNYRTDTRLQCDVLALGGLRDPEAGRTAIGDWRQMTEGAFSLRMFPGDHFFIQSAQTLLLRTLSLELRHAIERVPVLQGD
jgi:medium-chain acyl-[acyl-carrier-protein] hydrolase